MTDCNRQAVFFSSLGRQEVRADFAGGTLTSDGGGLLLREVDRRLGLVDALADCLTDPRDPARIRHEQRTMLAQRIFGIALGYEDLNDQNELRRDPLFSVLAEQTPRLGAEGALRDPLASSPTLCRLENRVDRKALVRMSAVLVEQFIAAFDTPPDELVLDFDPTDLPVHGQQERRFFHGFYGHYWFLPLKDTELQAAQVDTIRLKLFKVAARVVISVRRVVLHFSSAYPLHALFRRIAARLVARRRPHPVPT